MGPGGQDLLQHCFFTFIGITPSFIHSTNTYAASTPCQPCAGCRGQSILFNPPNHCMKQLRPLAQAHTAGEGHSWDSIQACLTRSVHLLPHLESAQQSPLASIAGRCRERSLLRRGGSFPLDGPTLFKKLFQSVLGKGKGTKGQET